MRYCKLFSQARHILQFGWLLNDTLIFLKNLLETSYRLYNNYGNESVSPKMPYVCFKHMCVLCKNLNCNVCPYELNVALKWF